MIHLNQKRTKASVTDAPLDSRFDSNLDLGYPIVFSSIDTLGDELEKSGLNASPCLLITDKNVDRLFGDLLDETLRSSGWSPIRKIIQPGEASKSAVVLGSLYDWALNDVVVNRKTPVFAVGGGVVGDLAGYFAATVLRGVPLIHIPTTLVSQVDSSIGGKTGINHGAGKNLIGAFYRPKLVFSDTAFLSTLPTDEWRSGLSEAIKHALIADTSLFERMRSVWPSLLKGSTDAGDVVQWSASVKIRTVKEDEYESGKRMLLNFGHTFGHAIERVAGYGEISHGQAVAVGMVAATILSSELHTQVDSEQILPVLSGLLPNTLGVMSGSDVVEAMQTDKKKTSDGLRLVLIEEIGKGYVRAGVSDEHIAKCFEAAKAIVEN